MHTREREDIHIYVRKYEYIGTREEVCVGKQIQTYTAT